MKAKVKYCSTAEYMQTILFQQNFESKQKLHQYF